jgi:formamidopyrimidine-DNA glycosylase
MPELPEVETIRRGLERRIIGCRIARIEIADSRLRTPLNAAALRESLVGRTITAVRRRSKYLLLDLSGDHVLVLHLGMSGRLVLLQPDTPAVPHTHVRLVLDREGELRFSDPRRFGMLFVVGRNELGAHPRFAHLGPEPLEPGFDAETLRTRASRVRKPIKNFLLDGAVVAGVGNIYACEALFHAGIHPRRAAGRLGIERWRALHAALLAVLGRAIRDGGTTLQDFRDADGRSGAFQRRLRVYGREGEACRRCGHTVRRIVQSGRSTFYCPGCQR